MTIQWKDSYKIGNAAIDGQHQVWFARINSFLQASDRKSLQYCEVMMNQHTLEHLKYEEQLMWNIQYPDIESHLQQHHDLLTKLSEIEVQIDNDTLDIFQWTSFLSDWLLTHIRVHDTRLSGFVNRLWTAMAHWPSSNRVRYRLINLDGRFPLPITQSALPLCQLDPRSPGPLCSSHESWYSKG
jgi:hemerythrin